MMVYIEVLSGEGLNPPAEPETIDRGTTVSTVAVLEAIGSI